MGNSYLKVLNYVEMRRRVEGRLGRHVWLLLHSSIFIIVSLSWMSNNLALDEYSPYFLPPNVSQMIGVWSLILLIHSAWTYRASGVYAGARSWAIEQQIREQVENDGVYLDEDSEQLFRVRGLLDEDIRQRAGIHKVLFIFTILNAMMWGLHLLVDRGSLVAWHGTQLLIITTVVLLGFAAYDRFLHERWMHKQFGDSDKPKKVTSHPVYEESLEIRDELVSIDEYLDKVKRES